MYPVNSIFSSLQMCATNRYITDFSIIFATKIGIVFFVKFKLNVNCYTYMRDICNTYLQHKQ